jgi:hypothetical protein
MMATSASNRASAGLRPVKWLIGSMVLLFAVLALSTTRTGEQLLPAPAPDPASVPHDLLQLDANMTQQMSTPNASVGQNHLRDEQLQRSQDRNYVQLLESHQADIDRMLARGGACGVDRHEDLSTRLGRRDRGSRQFRRPDEPQSAGARPWYSRWTRRIR